MTGRTALAPDDPFELEDVESIFYKDYPSIDVHDTARLLSPRIDYVFKRIFGSDDPEISGVALRGLLAAVLEIPRRVPV